MFLLTLDEILDRYANRINIPKKLMIEILKVGIQDTSTIFTTFSYESYLVNNNPNPFELITDDKLKGQ